MNTKEILSVANSAEQAIETVKTKLFDVVKIQLHPNLPDFESPLAYGVYKGTGGKPLGVMGKDFEPMQPVELMDNIIHTVHECGVDLDLSTLKFNPYLGGELIEFSLDLAPTKFVNFAGKEDFTKNELLFSTSYNGKKSNTISLYSYRQVCSNGMMAWKTDTLLKGKNTIGGKAKILTYCNEVSEIVTKSLEFSQKLEALDKIQVKQAKIDAFMLKLLGYNAKTLAKSDKSETKKINILDRINTSIETEFARTGATAFGLLQGVTHYTNHEANGSKTVSDNEYIRFYQGAKLNDKAQELVLQML